MLVGTDTRPLSSFVFSKTAPLIPGTYAAETGGAKLEAVVRALSGGAIRLTRRFAEPGASVQIKTYQLMRFPGGEYRAKGVWVRVTAGGDAAALLVLEERSGVEGIPPTLWIHLSKSNPPKESPR